MSSQSNEKSPKPTEEELDDFVFQSNKIEGEPDRPGHPLYDHHLRLAKLIALEPALWWDPLNIHRELLASQPEKFPGEMRQVNVSVGGEMKLLPQDVRVELPALVKVAQDVVFPAPGSKASLPADLEAWCWEMHHRFEWVHPFWDGNGRTGRLWMNSLRLSLGLPWLTVRYDDRFAYYRSIEEWEHEYEERLGWTRG